MKIHIISMFTSSLDTYITFMYLPLAYRYIFIWTNYPFFPGEFATQTCFQGRFGEEMGSDEFGSGILIHSPVPDQQWAIGRFSHIEVTHAGLLHTSKFMVDSRILP